jgi:hypothetical protein
MEKLEYMIDDIERSALWKYLNENNLGGWELVTMVQHAGNPGLFLVVSKRPLRKTK